MNKVSIPKYFVWSLLVLCSGALMAQEIDRVAYQNLDYRMIGPFRASRTVGGVGVPSQPNVFYMGVNNGGVWKTDDYGRTWNPIFDSAPTGSVGDIAVSESNPNILYVGNIASYTSADGGKTLKSLKGAPGGDDYHRIWIGCTIGRRKVACIFREDAPFTNLTTVMTPGGSNVR